MARVERRLAAILIADVAGYSRLIGADDVGTLAVLKADRKQVVDPQLAAYGGRLVKNLGDGFLAEFSSTVDAVACAITIQRAMLGRNRELPEDRRILFRLGIDLGDIIIEDGDVFGDGVNVAARLQTLAEPGGLCVSGAVYEQVRDKLPFAFADRGEQTLKNIARPVRAHALSASAMAALGEVPSPHAPAAAGQRHWLRRPLLAAGLAALVLLAVVAASYLPSLQRHREAASLPGLSIVVLPFTALGGDPGQDYLADIITEELTTGLSRIKGLFVIARSTAFTYKGKAVDVRQIGRDLGVRYVLEGSEQHSGDRVRVNAQLISAETGAHLWADQFDADKTEMLEMQDEIVARLARTLQVQLVEIESARIAHVRPGNLGAEDLAMRCAAIQFSVKPGSAEAERAYELCEQAVKIDPQNARALAMLAFKYIDRVVTLQSRDRESDMRQGEDLVSRALDIDPNLSQAHFAKAQLLLTQHRFDEAIAEAERVLALDPSFVGAYNTLSIGYSFLGQPEKGLAYAEKGMRLSPRDPYIYFFQFEKGFALAMMGRDSEALEWVTLAADAAPEWPLTQAVRASLLALTGHTEEAKATFEHYLSLKATTARTIEQWRSQIASAGPGFAAFTHRLTDGLRRAGMPEQ
jgi:adenylate cyclase